MSTEARVTLALPLRIGAPKPGTQFSEIYEANGRFVCYSHPYDAAEIVRAVNCHNDLLAACALALKCADDHGGDHFGYGEFVNEVRKAITNAEREEQKV